MTDETIEYVDYQGMRVPKAALERAQRRAAADRNKRWHRHLQTSTFMQGWVQRDIQIQRENFFRRRAFFWAVKQALDGMVPDRIMKGV